MSEDNEEKNIPQATFTVIEELKFPNLTDEQKKELNERYELLKEVRIERERLKKFEQEMKENEIALANRREEARNELDENQEPKHRQLNRVVKGITVARRKKFYDTILTNFEYYKYFLNVKYKAEEDKEFEELLESDYEKAFEIIIPKRDYVNFSKTSIDVLKKIHFTNMGEKYFNKRRGNMKDMFGSKYINLCIIDDLIRLKIPEQP